MTNRKKEGIRTESANPAQPTTYCLGKKCYLGLDRILPWYNHM